jgi:hypothetical protein|tara:strand:- start:958 stop:1656 length:699 start_codon:yes stop_codon:yes gene_type:complete
MKLAFCGDSYCAEYENDPYPSYPYLVAKEFNAEILCHGWGADCLFHSYEIMLDNIEEADYIIFCVTHSFRLANRYRIPITPQPEMSSMGWILENIPSKIFNKKRIAKKFETFVRIYYEEIMLIEYHDVTQRGLLREIDAVIKEYNKKCIFFKCFSPTFSQYTFENAVWGNLVLYDDISLAEGKNLMTINDSRLNHMNEQNNKNMANFLIDVIKKDDFIPREIKMDKYFNEKV